MNIPRIDYEDGDSLEKIFKEHRNLVYNRIFVSIRFGINNNLTEVVIFEVGDAKTYLDLLFDDWEDSLKKCMLYFSEIEEYEKCIECQKMITKIKEKN